MLFCVHKHYKQISYLVSAPHIYKIYGPGGTADHIYIYIYHIIIYPHDSHEHPILFFIDLQIYVVARFTWDSLNARAGHAGHEWASRVNQVFDLSQSEAPLWKPPGGAAWCPVFF